MLQAGGCANRDGAHRPTDLDPRRDDGLVDERCVRDTRAARGADAGWTLPPRMGVRRVDPRRRGDPIFRDGHWREPSSGLRPEECRLRDPVLDGLATGLDQHASGGSRQCLEPEPEVASTALAERLLEIPFVLGTACRSNSRGP